MGQFIATSIMKSALAVTAVASMIAVCSAELQVYQFSGPQVDYVPGGPTPDELVRTRVTALVSDQCPQVQMVVSNANAYKKRLLYVDCPAVADIASPKFSKIDDTTVAGKCFPNSVWTLGGDGQYCPHAYGSTCKANSFCPTMDNQGMTCSATGDETAQCLYPVPSKILYSQAKFESDYSLFATPPDIALTLNTAVNTHCPVYDISKLFSYPLNKHMTGVAQGWPVRDPTKCDAAAITEMMQKAVDAYKASPAYAEKPYPIISGSYEVKDSKDFTPCLSTETNTWSCRYSETGSVGDCKLPCPKGSSCQNSSDCGNGVPCLPDPDDESTKKCSARAAVAAVVPVIAAVAAMLMF